MSKKSKEVSRLKKTAAQTSTKLKTTVIKDGNIHFRFDYFDASHSFFDGSKADFDWSRNMIKRLRHLQDITVSRFKSDVRFKTSQYVHPINWTKANLDSFGIKTSTPELDGDAWQFAISKGNGRIHGFFVGHFFYIVWIDPEHRLYDYRKPN